MILNIAICDDNPEFLNILKKELYKEANKLSIEIEIYQYTKGKDVIDLITDKKEIIEILFLDIDMPGISGLEIADELRKKKSNIIIIFLSAYEKYVFDSIDYNPFKYIRKWRMKDELGVALKKAYKRIIIENKKNFWAKTEDGEVKIDNSDILYFEIESRKIVLYTCDNSNVVLIGRKTMKDLYKELNDENFIQIHSGCIVNVKYISEYSSHDITLDNGKQLIVSRTRIKDIKDAVRNYWRMRI